MPLTFYPHQDDAQKGSLRDRVDLMMEAAERYKAVVLDDSNKPAADPAEPNKRLLPRDLIAAYNWDELALVLRGIRELGEGTKIDKTKKADLLAKLADVYEVLRGAKMPKLEAVRLALVSEANQLRGNAAQVA